MDPAQLTMAAQQADATLAAQTTDQSLQAAIAQSRPDLWGSLATNPSTYPDLLAWLSSTGDATVLAILQARGYSPGAIATSAASGAAAAEGVEPSEEATAVADASDSGTSTEESEPSTEDEGEDAEESQDSDDADEPSDESETGEPDDSEKPEESEGPSAEDTEDVEEPVVDAEDAGDTEDPEDPEDAEGVEDSGGAENPEDSGDAEGADEEPAVDAEDSGDAEDTGHDAEESSSDSDEAEPSADESAGVESLDENEGSDEADEDVENDPEDASAVTAAEGAGSDSEPDTETLSETVSEETISDGDLAEPVGDEVEDETEGSAEDDAETGAEPETEVAAGDQSADGAASSGDEAVSSGEEPAGQTETIPPVEDTAVFASAGAAQVGTSAQSAAPAVGSAAPAAGSAESVAMPVAPPPSAEDIAAWAETPSGAPSGFSGAQPAVELDMFGPQMPPPQQQKQTSDSSRARLVAVIVVLLLVIVGGGGAWAGSYLSGKDKDDSSRTSQDNAAGDQGGRQDSGQADVVATAAALPSGTVQACSSMPTLRITSVEDGQGELKVQANVTTPCADGDFLAGSANQVLLYSSTSPTGGADVEHLVASGTFDLSSDPLIIPNGGRSLTLRFGEQHYFRTAKDLDLKSLKITPTFDRGSQPSVTSGSSANSPMTIASSTSSSVNQEQQDEQAAGEALRWQASHDRSLIMSKYLGKWTPQLSSKKNGLFADGQTWTNRMILAEFLKTRQTYPDAALVFSNDWSVFDSGGNWWVTLSGELYATADEANAWCDAQGYDAEHCLAKRMESSGPPQGTTKSR